MSDTFDKKYSKTQKISKEHCHKTKIKKVDKHKIVFNFKCNQRNINEIQ